MFTSTSHLQNFPWKPHQILQHPSPHFKFPPVAPTPWTQHTCDFAYLLLLNYKFNKRRPFCPSSILLAPQLVESRLAYHTQYVSIEWANTCCSRKKCKCLLFKNKMLHYFCNKTTKVMSVPCLQVAYHKEQNHKTKKSILLSWEVPVLL